MVVKEGNESACLTAIGLRLPGQIAVTGGLTNILQGFDAAHDAMRKNGTVKPPTCPSGTRYPTHSWRNKMKKIAAVLLAVAMAGCSSMSMNSSGSSSMSSTGSGGSMGASVNQNPVIAPNGNLSLYHGG